MGKVIKTVLGLALAGLVGLVVYGYGVDMRPASKSQSIDVVLDAK